ncbi:hypothetical protein D9M69_684770 [compost metagenome]
MQVEARSYPGMGQVLLQDRMQRPVRPGGRPAAIEQAIGEAVLTRFDARHQRRPALLANPRVEQGVRPQALRPLELPAGVDLMQRRVGLVGG